jgi:hypothetical protein
VYDIRQLSVSERMGGVTLSGSLRADDISDGVGKRYNTRSAKGWIESAMYKALYIGWVEVQK